jgi:hypothetical protein
LAATIVTRTPARLADPTTDAYRLSGMCAERHERGGGTIGTWG